MKKRVDLFPMLFMILFFCNSSLAGETVIITTGEYPPEYSESLKYYGLTPHIVTESFASEGIDVKWKFYPWARAMYNVKRKEADASCCWTKTEERQKDFLFSDPLHTKEKVLFHLKSYNFDWKTVGDLKGIPIGGTIAHTYGKEFDKAEKAGEIKIERVGSGHLNWKKLLHGRFKLYIAEKKMGYATLSETLPDKTDLFTHHPRPVQTYQSHLIISKDHDNGEELTNRFNEGLKKLRKGGKYDLFYEESMRGDYIIKK
ncbi:transporter substrate-binding domain-containing protein [Desulfococcaceae bacterium HSG8]|nr:transporter substrate-binding domain-containing protein [Desulfococcaceae bacterium HSG8]